MMKSGELGVEDTELRGVNARWGYEKYEICKKGVRGEIVINVCNTQKEKSRSGIAAARVVPPP